MYKTSVMSFGLQAVQCVIINLFLFPAVPNNTVLIAVIVVIGIVVVFILVLALVILIVCFMK